MKLDWIPQLFMDFIGRVLPGAAVLMAGLVVVTGHVEILATFLSKDKGEINWAFILPLLLICYLLGFCLTQMWYLLLKRFTERQITETTAECKNKRLEDHQKLQESLGRPPIPLTAKDLPASFVMHDHLRISLPVEATRLLKLRSELGLCHGLIVGFGLLCLLNLWFIWKQYTIERIWYEVVMVGVVIATWGWTFRLERYFVNGVSTLWLALVSTSRLLLPPGTASGGTTAADGDSE